ncbi:MAG: Sec-independent protein translocase subunit TatB [Aquincola sp.]|nr:Sec-independent protein translocase subunit TatB [Aquincola sp.]MDH4288680.1 Sec-independent protein translocase subunit TatB [Aquincola sp.]
MALIGAVALIVIGPEKLPRVARTVGHMIGKAQRYVADVKAEVNRSIELEELQKMKTQFETAARDVEQTVNTEMRSATSDLESQWKAGDADSASAASALEGLATPLPEYRHPKKNWRLKRGAMPAWYKQRAGIRTKALSGAARVARYRPKPLAR